jgi:hypothetical protein
VDSLAATGDGSAVSDARYEILDEAVDDSIGLWEVPMAVRKLLPERNSEEQREIAKQAVISLLEEDLITFFWRNDADPSSQLEKKEAVEELKKDRWWQVPESSDPDKNWYDIDWLWMAATVKGQDERDRQARARFSLGES